MRRRIFIAINLPENLRRKLANYQNNWPELPVRWIKPENIHITLVFIGYVSDEELLEISRTAKEVAARHSPFFVNLNKICYGPPKKMPPRPPKFSEATVIEKDKNSSNKKFWRPRMIWTMGKKSQDLASLRDDLEKSLAGSERVGFSPEKRGFSLHITLGRIRQWEWRKIEPEERPEIEQELNLGFSADSIEVMESQLKKGGAEYVILESHNLGE